MSDETDSLIVRAAALWRARSPRPSGRAVGGDQRRSYDFDRRVVHLEDDLVEGRTGPPRRLDADQVPARASTMSVSLLTTALLFFAVLLVMIFSFIGWFKFM